MPEYAVRYRKVGDPYQMPNSEEIVSLNLEALFSEPTIDEKRLEDLLSEYYAEGLCSLVENLGSCDLMRVSEEPNLTNISALPVTGEAACLLFEDEVYFLKKAKRELTKIALPSHKKIVLAAYEASPSVEHEKFRLLTSFTGINLSGFLASISVSDDRLNIILHPIVLGKLREETTVERGSKDYMSIRQDYPYLCNALAEIYSISDQFKFLKLLLLGLTSHSSDIPSDENQYWPIRDNIKILTFLFEQLTPIGTFEKLEGLLRSGQCQPVWAETFFSFPNIRAYLRQVFVENLGSPALSANESDKNLLELENKSIFLFRRVEDFYIEQLCFDLLDVLPKASEQRMTLEERLITGANIIHAHREDFFYALEQVLEKKEGIYKAIEDAAAKKTPPALITNLFLAAAFLRLHRVTICKFAKLYNQQAAADKGLEAIFQDPYYSRLTLKACQQLLDSTNSADEFLLLFLVWKKKEWNLDMLYRRLEKPFRLSLETALNSEENDSISALVRLFCQINQASERYAQEISKNLSPFINRELEGITLIEKTAPLLAKMAKCLFGTLQSICATPTPEEIKKLFKSLERAQPNSWKIIFVLYYRETLHQAIKTSLRAGPDNRLEYNNTLEKCIGHLFRFSKLEISQIDLAHILTQTLFYVYGPEMLDLLSRKISELFEKPMTLYEGKINIILIEMSYCEVSALEIRSDRMREVEAEAELVRIKEDLELIISQQNSPLSTYAEIADAYREIVYHLRTTGEVRIGETQITQFRNISQLHTIHLQVDAWVDSLRPVESSPIYDQFTVFLNKIQPVIKKKDQLIFEIAETLQKQQLLQLLQHALSRKDILTLQTLIKKLSVILKEPAAIDLKLLIQKLQQLCSPEKTNHGELTKICREQTVLNLQICKERLDEIAVELNSAAAYATYLQPRLPQSLTERLKGIIWLKETLRQDIAANLRHLAFKLSDEEKLAVVYIWKYTTKDTIFPVEKLVMHLLEGDIGFCESLLSLQAEKYLCLAKGQAYQAPKNRLSIFSRATQSNDESMRAYFGTFNFVDSEDVSFRKGKLREVLAKDGNHEKVDAMFAKIQAQITSTLSANTSTPSRPF